MGAHLPASLQDVLAGADTTAAELICLWYSNKEGGTRPIYAERLISFVTLDHEATDILL